MVGATCKKLLKLMAKLLSFHTVTYHLNLRLTIYRWCATYIQKQSFLHFVYCQTVLISTYYTSEPTKSQTKLIQNKSSAVEVGCYFFFIDISFALTLHLVCVFKYCCSTVEFIFAFI